MVKSEYPFLSGKEFIKFLFKLYHGEVISQKGSHIKKKIGNKKTIIPNHKTLAYGTFHTILEQLEINETDFLNQIK